MARRKGSIIDFNVDTAELETAIGAVNALTTTVHTDKFLAPLVEATHRQLADDFNLFMDGFYNTPRFHHMFEWNTPGAAGRLWKHELKGRGANRFASFSFVPSKKPIPTPEERADNPKDPMSKVPDNIIEGLSDTTYVFTWKAPTMEYNHTVNILPVNADMLFITTTKAPYYAFVDEVTVNNPGGEATTGAFTGMWVQYWANTAPEAMERHINREVEAGIEGNVRRTLASGKARTAQVGISTFGNYSAAFKYGQEWSEKNLNAWAKEYRARQMERIILEYAD